MQINLRQITGILCLAGLLSSPACMAVQVVNYRLPSTSADQYEFYVLALLTLALEKTRPEYGEFLLQPIPESVNRLRAKKALVSNEFPNLIIEDSYDGTQQAKVTQIEFPLDLGVMGYRVCFVNPQVQQQVAATDSLEKMKAFSILQGINWADTKILSANGFQTIEMSAYKSYYRMVASGRADLFCLGANQVMNEYMNNSANMSLKIDSSFYFYYKLPRFFYLNKRNTLLKERVEKGLLLAYQDQSLQALWRKNFSRSLDFVRMNMRKKIALENPLLKQLNPAYEQYFLQPAVITSPSQSSSDNLLP